MEKFDLYDDNRLPLNRCLERGEKCKENENRMVVHICIFNSKNEMLIQQRVATKEAWPNRWDVSVGGSSISGENSREAAHRELFEELGINFDFSKVRPNFTMNFPNGFDDFYLLNFNDLDISNLTLQEDEVSRVKWASKEEILAYLNTGEFIPYYQNFMTMLFELKDSKGIVDQSKKI